MENGFYYSISGYRRFESILNPRVSKEVYRELKEYADNKGVYLSDFKDYTGDIEVIEDIIDKICIVAKDFPLILKTRKHVELRLRFEDSSDFAGTNGRSIFLNGLFYDDPKTLEEHYKEMVDRRDFVYGTTWKDIIFHELGHVVYNVYKIPILAVSKDILNTKSSSDVYEYVYSNLSHYAVRSYVDTFGKAEVFDGAEIISESFCAYYAGVNNEFAKKVVEECIKLTKEVQ